MTRKTSSNVGNARSAGTKRAGTCQRRTRGAVAASAIGLPDMQPSAWIAGLEHGDVLLQILDKRIRGLATADVILHGAHHVPVPIGEPQSLGYVARGGDFQLV